MNSIHLQGMRGEQPAKPVKELKVGDKLMWNYGFTSTVLELHPSKSGKSVEVVSKTDQTGYVGKRTMRADRLVAIA